MPADPQARGADSAEPTSRPSIKQVAARANVSWKTVSNVINGTAPVREATRLKVEQAIAELGYRPNLSGRNLRQGRTYLLALAFPEICNPYFANLAHRVIVAARARGYRVLIDETFADAESERMVAGGFGVHLLDGIIFSPQALASHDVAAVHNGLPIVLLGEHGLPGIGESPVFDHVVIDNVRSAREATEHLLAQGRRHIAFLGAGAGLSYGTGALRRSGYEAALSAAGMGASSTFLTPAYTRPVGAATIAAEISAFRGDGAIDGLVCANDQLAIGAMYTLRNAGLRIPEDVAVVGWDNIEEGEFSSPPLTTIAPDPAELAQTAVDLLVNRIDGASSAPKVHIIPHVIHVRESSVGAQQD